MNAEVLAVVASICPPTGYTSGLTSGVVAVVAGGLRINTIFNLLLLRERKPHVLTPLPQPPEPLQGGQMAATRADPALGSGGFRENRNLLPTPPTVAAMTIRDSTRTPNSPSTNLLTAEQVADRWQVPPAHVYRLAREGKVQTVRLGRYRRWRVADIEQFEQEGGADA